MLLAVEEPGEQRHLGFSREYAKVVYVRITPLPGAEAVLDLVGVPGRRRDGSGRAHRAHQPMAFASQVAMPGRLKSKSSAKTWIAMNGRTPR